MLTCDGCLLPGASMSTTADGRDMCDSCVAEFWSCENCSELIDAGDYCSSCDHTDCECGDCYGNDNGSEWIHDYSYRPRPVFHGEGPRFLGLELEIDVRDIADDADTAARHLGDLGYLKEDGSINNGFEIVTHPMTYAYAMDNFPWRMLSELAANDASGEGNGIHVHVSRAAFASSAHVYRWMKLFYRNKDAVSDVARRHNSSWASFTSEDRAHVKHAAKGDRDGRRYQAINSQNDDTFELRIFASSLDRQEVSAALGLTDASVKYTRDLSVTDVVAGAWDWPAFTAWLDTRPEYAPLSRELESVSCAY
jgi:hypothetical protein